MLINIHNKQTVDLFFIKNINLSKFKYLSVYFPNLLKKNLFNYADTQIIM